MYIVQHGNHIQLSSRSTCKSECSLIVMCGTLTNSKKRQSRGHQAEDQRRSTSDTQRFQAVLDYAGKVEAVVESRIPDRLWKLGR